MTYMNLVPPTIKADPKDVTVRNGKKAVFTVNAKGAKSYQWQVSNNRTGWQDIPKATKKKLTISKVDTYMDGYAYRCIAINADGETISEAAYLDAYLVPPTVTTQPKNVLTFQSRKATFTVKAKEAKKYQWQVNEGYGWEDIPKATSSKLTVKKVTVDMFGNQYRCVVTNADGETFSDAATLMVMP